MLRFSRPGAGHRTPALAATLVSLLLGAPSDGRSQEFFEGWVALYEPDQIEWLGNEYRLDELCPSSDPAGFSECFERVSAPLVRTILLHEAPDPSAPVLGEIITVAVPGGTLTAHYRPAAATSPRPFTPDLFLADWGYGPYFHQTVAERQGEWVGLPAGPWPAAVWIRRPDVDAALVHVRPGDIVDTVDGRSWVVTATERDRLSVRTEIPADFWCEMGDPPPAEPEEPIWRTRAELLDDRGHLVVRPKYMKGC